MKYVDFTPDPNKQRTKEVIWGTVFIVSIILLSAVLLTVSLWW